MTTISPAKTIRVALIGNPNTGKSTLFTALAGVRQRVGNYPGVTVEKKIGHLRHDGHTFELVDLPGTYSLAPRSPDEMVAVDLLLGRRDNLQPPDVVLSHRRRQQSRAQFVSGEPGAVAGVADGRGAQHGRSGARPARSRSTSRRSAAIGSAGGSRAGQPPHRAGAAENCACRGCHEPTSASRRSVPKAISSAVARAGRLA